MNNSSNATVITRRAFATLAIVAGSFHGAFVGAQQAAGTRVSPMVLTSPSLREGGRIPNEFTCAAGQNFKSPELTWTGVPADAVSLVLYLHDLDPHPNGGSDDVLHWVAWNIPATAKGLPGGVKNEAGAIPGAIQGVNTHGTVGYYGPCPPPGQPDHHYVFEVFALNKTLSLAEKATRRELLDGMHGVIVGHGVMVSLFSRTQ